MLDALGRAEGAPAAELVRDQPHRPDRRHRARPRGLRPRRLPRRPAPGGRHRCAPHGRPRRPADRRRPRRRRPAERRPARDAGGGDRRLRPPLFQAEDRRRPRGRRRPPRPDRRRARPARRLPRHPRRQRAVPGPRRRSPPSSTGSPPHPASIGCAARSSSSSSRWPAPSPSRPALDCALPVEIDEADGAIDAFADRPRPRLPGVSAKSCKGFTRALLNRARVAAWNAEAGADRYFMSAEDLTTQAGIAVQQDLLLATLVGATHVERNGHHYVDGMAGAPEAEQARVPRRPPRPLPPSRRPRPPRDPRRRASRSPASRRRPASARPSSPTGRR